MSPCQGSENYYTYQDLAKMQKRKETPEAEVEWRKTGMSDWASKCEST